MNNQKQQKNKAIEQKRKQKGGIKNQYGKYRVYYKKTKNNG